MSTICVVKVCFALFPVSLSCAYCTVSHSTIEGWCLVSIYITTSNTNAASNAPAPSHFPDFAGKDGEMIWRKKEKPVQLSWCSLSVKNRDGVERCRKPWASQWCPMSFTRNENCIMINQRDRWYRNNLLTLSYVLTFRRPASVVLVAGDRGLQILTNCGTSSVAIESIAWQTNWWFYHLSSYLINILCITKAVKGSSNGTARILHWNYGTRKSQIRQCHQDTIYFII